MLKGPLVPRPELDGVDHLNVYSRARTEVGRWMSNFTVESPPVVFGSDGAFASVEGYWFWLLSGGDGLRTLGGAEAKRAGSAVRGHAQGQFRSSEDPGFKVKIEEAIRARAERRPDMVALLQSDRYRDLPLEHYYVDRNNRPIMAGHRWVLDVWTRVRAGT